MSAGPTPLSAKIELPAAFHEVIGEYKRAIAEVKKELREVEKEAAEVLKVSGKPDEALLRRAEALAGVSSNLQRKADELAANRQQEAEETLREKRVAFAGRALEEHVGSGPGAHMGVGLVRQAAALPGQAAATFKELGMTRAAAAATSVAESAAVKEVAAVAKNPYALLAIATVGAGLKVWDMSIASDKAKGEAMGKAAEDLTRLSGGPIHSKVLDHGSAGQAINIRNDMIEASHKGLEAFPRGFGDMIANLFGFESAAQVANEEKYRQHAVKLEEAHQRFGLDKEFDHEGTRKQADILFRRKQVSLEYRWSQIKNFWRLGTIEDAARDEARMQAEQQAMDSETKRRATIEAQWNNGLDGAINRVLENEKRRWLRAVEQDRAARFASWSLT